MEKENQIQTPAEATKVLAAPVTRRDEVSTLKQFNRVLMNVDMQSYLTTVLGTRKESFVNNILALVSNDTKLQGCTPNSLIFAGTKATALGLPLDSNLGFAYVIPYNNKKKVEEVQYIKDAKTGQAMPTKVTVDLTVKEAQFQLGYRGFIQLALRTGQFKSINVTDVREGELGERNIITGDIVIAGVPNRDTKPVIGYVAYFALNNGFSKMLYMSMDEIKAHASKYSQTYGSRFDNIRQSSKWTTDFDAMARKTVLKLLLNRYAPLSVEMQGMPQLQDAIRSDQAVLDEQGNPNYVDGVDDQTQNENAVEDAKQQLRGKESTAPTLL